MFAKSLLNSNIIQVPKKEISATNNRGYLFFQSLLKFKLLLIRIRPHSEPILSKNQNGFRSTLTQIIAPPRILEEGLDLTSTSTLF